MTRFVVGDDRSQSTLFPERLDDYLGSDNPVRAIDVLVDELDLAKLGFDGVEPEATVGPNCRMAEPRSNNYQPGNSCYILGDDKLALYTDKVIECVAHCGPRKQ